MVWEANHSSSRDLASQFIVKGKVGKAVPERESRWGLRSRRTNHLQSRLVLACAEQREALEKCHECPRRTGIPSCADRESCRAAWRPFRSRTSSPLRAYHSPVAQCNFRDQAAI